jgi:TatD DNase family protein
MNFIDNHCHLSDERIFDRAETLVKEATEAKVTRFALAGVEPAEWKRQVELKAKFGDSLILNFGLHPWWVEKYSASEIKEILQILDQEIVHANGVGETGLDFYEKRDPSRFDDQREAFRAQIHIAKRHKKPLILHIVQAHEECVKILKEEKAEELKLVLHSYSGNVTQLQEYLKLGAYVSYSGSLVKAARGEGHEKTAKALLNTPINRVLFETDSPDQGWDSGENAPKRVLEVYEAALVLMELPLASGMGAMADVVTKTFNHIYAK